MQKVITNGEGRISLLKEYRLEKNSLDPEVLISSRHGSEPIRDPGLAATGHAEYTLTS
jgi:hypothetical protein